MRVKSIMISIFMMIPRIKLVQSKKHCLQKKNEKPTMTAAALAPKNDSQITFAMK